MIGARPARYDVIIAGGGLRSLLIQAINGRDGNRPGRAAARFQD